MSILSFAAFVFPLTIASAPSFEPAFLEETCSPRVERTSKALYDLTSSDGASGQSSGSLIRSETETFSADGRRQRVEWINPDGSRALTFVELYSDSERPYGAWYVENGGLEPTLEAFTWSDDGRVKTVEYRNSAGEVTGRSQYFYDEENREIERRYGVEGDAFSSSDTIQYDGPNEIGYTWSRRDGSASSEVRYDIQAFDVYGNWTVRRTIRNEVPTMIEVRSIVYSDEPCLDPGS